MAKKKPQPESEQLNAKRELFCRYYTQNSELFGNATFSYGEAFDYKLDELPRDDAVYEEIENEETGEIEQGKLITPSTYDRAYHVCGVEASKLLKKPEIQKRIRELLNELLKDDVVDSELAKLIQQDRDLPTKIRSIGEYNKLRGRIIDKTQITNRLPFGESDLSTVIGRLPQERQDYFYGVIRDLIEEAEAIGVTDTAASGGTR